MIPTGKRSFGTKHKRSMNRREQWNTQPDIWKRSPLDSKKTTDYWEPRNETKGNRLRDLLSWCLGARDWVSTLVLKTAMLAAV